MQKQILSLSLGALTFGASLLSAASTNSGIALTADVGTLGVGGSVWYTLSPSFTVSAGLNYLDYSVDDVEAVGTNYDGKLKMANVPVLLHWHPFKGTFRVFGGVGISDNKVNVRGKFRAGDVIDIGDQTFTQAQVGDVLGNVKIAKGASALLGVGWSKSPETEGWGGFLDLGVLFSGNPTGTIDVTGPIRANPLFQTELAKEVDELNRELDSYKVYPVIRGGVMYRF